MEIPLANRAVFLDRDGVIIKDVDYLADPEMISFIPGSIAAIKSLQQSFKIVLITNQSGVARGLIREDKLLEIHNILKKLLADRGTRLDAIYYCPHHPEADLADYRLDCECRKPKPGLIFKAATDLKIELSESYMIGDKESDIEAGNRAGCKSILIKPGRQLSGGTKALAVFPTLKKAASFILNDSNRKNPTD